MALEKREGRLYYYRSVRRGGQVRRVYVASGELARSAHEQEIMDRAAEEHAREAERAEIERLEALAAPVVELCEVSEVMREEIAGENPTPLEVLLTERVVACWLLVEFFDALMAAQLWTKTPSEKRVSIQMGKFYLHWQDLANRRFLSSVQTLARVRKLQGTTPGIQVNAQINLRSD